MDLKWIRAVIFQEGYFREFSWWRTEPCRLVRGSAGTPKTTSRSYTPGGFSLLRLPSNPVGKPPHTKNTKIRKTKTNKNGKPTRGTERLTHPTSIPIKKNTMREKIQKNPLLAREGPWRPVLKLIIHTVYKCSRKGSSVCRLTVHMSLERCAVRKPRFVVSLLLARSN